MTKITALAAGFGMLLLMGGAAVAADGATPAQTGSNFTVLEMYGQET